MKFVELQSWGRHVWNFSHERARVERGGNLDWIFGAIGSRLTKNFTELDLAGEGATGTHVWFLLYRWQPASRPRYAAESSCSAYDQRPAVQGRVERQEPLGVAGHDLCCPGAQKTDGYQANRNLVLSDGARADSIPGLEILADDVRCTHGATVGKLEQEPLFYLKSRGIPQAEAEKIVVEGFFDPIFQRIPFEGVRERFQQYIAR